MITRLARPAVLGPIAAQLAACSGPQSVLDPHGPLAANIAQLIWFIIAVCTLVWLVVVAVLIAALWRRSDTRSDSIDPDEGRERSMHFIVGAAVTATAIIIAGFTLASFVATRGLQAARDGDLVIYVRGEQWWWNIAYVDQDPARAFVTANELRIPVGRNIRLQLEASDVIHSFWVPSLAGKLDLVPGRQNVLIIRADRAGIYRGQCAEFCGMQHAHMGFLVIAEDEAAFRAWSDRQRAPAAEPENDETRFGRQAFLAKPCAACHTVRGTSATGTTGPDLTHVGGRSTLASGLLDTTRGSIAAWIADPQTLKPGNNMPMVSMSAEELQAISAYMAILK